MVITFHFWGAPAFLSLKAGLPPLPQPQPRDLLPSTHPMWLLSDVSSGCFSASLLLPHGTLTLGSLNKETGITGDILCPRDSTAGCYLCSPVLRNRAVTNALNPTLKGSHTERPGLEIPAFLMALIKCNSTGRRGESEHVVRVGRWAIQIKIDFLNLLWFTSNLTCFFLNSEKVQKWGQDTEKKINHPLSKYIPRKKGIVNISSKE